MITQLVSLLLLIAAVNSFEWIPEWKPYNFCRNISNCKCESIGDAHKLTCPHLNENVKLVRHGPAFIIRCLKAQSRAFDFKTFPALPIQSVKKVIVENCLIPRNDTFGLLLDHLGLKNATFISYHNTIPEEVLLYWPFFNGLEHLEELRLNGNIKINENSFEALTNLTKLVLEVKSLHFLQNRGFFRNLKKLEEISLDGNLDERENRDQVLEYMWHSREKGKSVKTQLENISGDLISSSINIEQFALNGNRLSLLPLNLFANQSRMSVLDLSRNELTKLQDGIFDDMKGIVKLVLSDNNLTSISGTVFRELHRLETLRIDDNYLTTIHSNAFVTNKALQIITLCNNQLSFIDEKSPFRNLNELSLVNLNNNQLTTILSDWKNQIQVRLDLGSNQISSLNYDDLQFNAKSSAKNIDIKVNFTDNDITNIDFPTFIMNELLNNSTNNVKVELNNNPIECDDCKLYNFIEYIQRQSHQAITIVANQLLCGSPKSLVDRRVRELNLLNFTCVLEETNGQCPLQCHCLRRPNDNALIYNCSNRLVDLLHIPDEIQNFSSIEIHIDHNRLFGLPYMNNNEQVTVIQASHNSISEITMDNLSPNLIFLDLSHNKIQRLAENVFKMLNSHTKLKHIYLGNNPWSCDCSQEAEHFIAFVKEHDGIIADQKQIKCLAEFITVSELPSEYIQRVCLQKYLKVTLITIAASVTLISLLAMVYYKYQQLIKIWLYTHNLCLWWVSDEDLDVDMKYDAFISYSHQDEDFAVDTIVDELENGERKFKVCVHERDWLAGELIIEAIAKSVANSRRTNIILYQNYLDSVWGQYEFHYAHETSITEKRICVIVIIYGDIGNIDDLDLTLQLYLKTNTYIKWGEKWFWKKLRYAMQHND